MAGLFDLESLVTVEQTFYDQGYEDGYAHGRIHGLIEGRELGREKGFEMWEELGFYKGFAVMWRSIYISQQRQDDRAMHHIKHLLDQISQFPMVNPSSVTTTTAEKEADIEKLFRQIRSRYKILCATIGVKPPLRAADGAPVVHSDQSESPSSQKKPDLGTDADGGRGEGMSADPSSSGAISIRRAPKGNQSSVWDTGE